MGTEYVGIELAEPIENGHNGTIGGYQYFSAPKGYGFHTKLGSVCRKILPFELVTKLRELLSLFTAKCAEQDKYIKKLQHRLSSQPNARIKPILYDKVSS